MRLRPAFRASPRARALTCVGVRRIDWEDLEEEDRLDSSSTAEPGDRVAQGGLDHIRVSRNRIRRDRQCELSSDELRVVNDENVFPNAQQDAQTAVVADSRTAAEGDARTNPEQDQSA